MVCHCLFIRPSSYLIYLPYPAVTSFDLVKTYRRLCVVTEIYIEVSDISWVQQISGWKMLLLLNYFTMSVNKRKILNCYLYLLHLLKSHLNERFQRGHQSPNTHLLLGSAAEPLLIPCSRGQYTRSCWFTICRHRTRKWTGRSECCITMTAADSGAKPIQNAMKMAKVAIHLDGGNKHKVGDLAV